MESKTFGNYKVMEHFVGKKDNLFFNFRPMYDSTSLLTTLKTFLFGKSKKEYDGSVMNLLGKRAKSIFNKYQVWFDSRYYISTCGFDGISFGFGENGIITSVSYGRSLNGKGIIERAKEYAKEHKVGLKVSIYGNMRGIYYDVKMVDKKPQIPYVNITKSSTFSGKSEKTIEL